jgi:fatty-acyl-CoA synthase
MLGYFNDPERTRAAFEGGWFHSGDLAVIDHEG